MLYGTGVITLDDKEGVVRTGGVKYTIKDGIIYDSRKLLADVRRMVKEAKEATPAKAAKAAKAAKPAQPPPPPQASLVPDLAQPADGEPD